MSPYFIELLRNCPYALSVDGDCAGARGFRALAEHIKANNCNLQHLTLGTGSIQQASARELAEALKVNASVKTLCISGMEIGNEEAKILGEAIEQNRTLERFSLSIQRSYGSEKAFFDAIQKNISIRFINVYGCISQDAMVSLAKAIRLSRSLADIQLSSGSILVDILSEALKMKSSGQKIALHLEISKMNESSAKVFGEGIKHCEFLAKLELSDNGINSEAAKAIARGVLENPNLQCLSILENKIGTDGTKAFAETLQKSKFLQELHLCQTGMGFEGVEAIANAIENNVSLLCLALNNNEIGDEGAKLLARAISVTNTLEKLELDDNDISDKGAAFLADALQINTSLQVLDLESNRIGPNGASFLAESLSTNTTLQRLDLFGNGIGPKGAFALANSIKVSNSLEILIIRQNAIGCEGAEHFAGALEVNGALKILDLRGNAIGGSGANALVEAIQSNISIEVHNMDVETNKQSDLLAKSLARNRETAKIIKQNAKLASIGDHAWRRKLLGVLMARACQKCFPELSFLMLQRHLDAVLSSDHASLSLAKKSTLK